ncbi:hypothetical protein, partial [Vibrio sp. 10N.261.54.E10]
NFNINNLCEKNLMTKNSYYVELESKIRAMDIPSMYKLDDAAYREMVKTELFFVDSHDVLRDEITGHPIATSVEQLDILLEELNIMRSRMVSRNS